MVIFRVGFTSFVLLRSEFRESIDDNTENNVKGDDVHKKEKHHVKKEFLVKADSGVADVSEDKNLPYTSSVP